MLEELEALRADNWFHQHGDRSPGLAKEVADEMRKAYYPDSEERRQSVLHRSAQVLTRALAGLRLRRLNGLSFRIAFREGANATARIVDAKRHDLAAYAGVPSNADCPTEFVLRQFPFQL